MVLCGDISGAGGLGIRTIFIDSNQGAKAHENCVPDYVAHRFTDVLTGIDALRDEGREGV